MSTVYTPTSTNIFMADFEKKYIYELIKDRSLLFLCYFFLYLENLKSEIFLKLTERKTFLYIINLKV